MKHYEVYMPDGYIIDVYAGGYVRMDKPERILFIDNGLTVAEFFADKIIGWKEKKDGQTN